MKLLRVLFCFLLIACLALAVAPESTKATFQCSLRTQGYLGGCSNIYVRWFDQQPALNYTIRYADGYTITVPGSRQNWNRPEQPVEPTNPEWISCGWGGQITIIGTYATGGTCFASYTGNLPHNRPCDQCSANGTVNLDGVQNAANGRAYGSPNSILSAYGQGITMTTLSAPSLPLPTELAGVHVFADDAPCQLFFVSPSQVNFLIPNVGVGLKRITVTNDSGSHFVGDIFLTHPAPGVFMRRDGITAAVDWYPWGVSLYATGIDPALVADVATVRLRTRGIEYPASWIGWAPGYVGLVQINVPLPAGVAGAGASLFVGSAESQGFILR